jgi:AbiV family abortive infection protein
MQSQAEVERIRTNCIENAEELWNAALLVAEQHRNHIAYHLAALALEEIGKSSMVFMSSLRSGRGDGAEGKRPIDWIDDHERKLFWAIWSLRFNKGDPSKSIQQSIDIAKFIHETRLNTLYVDVNDPAARTRISDDEVQNLLKLTEAQIGLEKAKKPRDMSDEEKADLEWFFAATDDPYLKTIVFSKGSFDKQVEFGEDTLEWVRWLKGIIAENNALNIELAKREINRVPPDGKERYEDKWEFTIRLKSWSHSIRQKPLTDWNGKVEKIKFYTGSGKSELLMKFIVPKNVVAQQAWQFGMHNSFLLVTAINIGTTGFFWWYLPAFVSTYADGIIDLENKAKVAFERVPQLKVSWGNLALRQEDLTQVSIVFSHIATIKESAQQAVYQRYFKALALMAKNDIFFQFEGNLLVEFHLVLKEAFAAYGDWDGKEETYDAAIDVVFQALRSGTDFTSSLHDLAAVALMTMRGENKTRPVTLEDVAKLKVGCDFYLLMKARAHMQREIEALRAAEVASSQAEAMAATTNSPEPP